MFNRKWLISMVLVSIFLFSMAFKVYYDDVEEREKYSQFIEGDYLYYPVFNVSGWNITVADDAKWVYSSGFGGGTGAWPIVAVDLNAFGDKARNEQVLVINNVYGINNRFNVLVPDSGLRVYYSFERNSIPVYGLDFKGVVVRDGVLYYVYDAKCDIRTYLVTAGILWLVIVVGCWDDDGDAIRNI